uniref:Uncharacterized protein n=1 Tax=Parascaris equorum TaxID=6256 RepID=A0A914RRB4_PAREQ
MVSLTRDHRDHLANLESPAVKEDQVLLVLPNHEPHQDIEAFGWTALYRI